ncbi:MAG: hypothetical protein ACRC7O_07545 [Fimbriiglobus sp.]
MPTRTAPADCPQCAAPLQVGYAAAKSAHTPRSAWLVFAAAAVASFALVCGLFPAVLFAWKPALDAGNLNWKDRGAVLSITYIVLLPPALWPARRGWRFLMARFLTTTVTCESCGWTGPVRVIEERGAARGTEVNDAKRKMQKQRRPAAAPEPPNPELDFTGSTPEPR